MHVISPDHMLILDGTDWRKIFEGSLTSYAEDLMEKVKVSIYVYTPQLKKIHTFFVNTELLLHTSLYFTEEL